MRVAHLHVLFEEAGGGEVLALQMYRALTELGHEVDLYTTHVDPHAWSVLSNNFRNEVPKPKVVRVAWVGVLRKVASGRAVRLRRVIAVKALNSALRGMFRDYDVVIETQSNFPMNVSLSYIHFPAIYGYLEEKGSGPVWRAYNWAVRRLIKGALGTPRAVLTNSRWTADHVARAYGLSAEVLNPPIRYTELAPLASGHRRSDVVLTVSRISPEKHLEALPRIAKMVPQADFYLVGSTSVYSAPVLDLIRRTAEEVGADNFHMVLNAPWEKLKGLYSEAKVYLHPPFAEHFGISVAEGSASGALPVVFRDGGAWTDIVGPLLPWAGYEGLEEAARAVRKALREWTPQLAAKVSRSMARFSYEEFRGRLGAKVKELAGRK